MYVIIRVSGGELYEGIVLAAGGNRMRIVLRDCHDTVELSRAGGQWTLEDGKLVEFESVISSAGPSSLLLSPSPVHAPRQAA